MDAYKLTTGSLLGPVIAGKIESGQVKLNDKVKIVPANINATVRAI